MDDLIRRQDAIDAVEKLHKMINEDMGYMTVHKDDVIKYINAVPSAEKTGKWIERGDYKLGYKCDQCGGFSLWTTPFCPNCGIRMVSNND